MDSNSAWNLVMFIFGMVCAWAVIVGFKES
ncbi:hypothetical protein FEP54_04704 [Burkholderia multivorans]|nr:hypothetical protein [Burkholderia multivorans]MDR8925971.1 hypothetical protein [Burkholderia multivorans]MDR8967208.1 hypothetical protein [Burkholderia multivorans]MDR8993017.1 hypothetical protein [Burkholderia multivorans]MDR9023325.1 hypothetical protein [Burkholderia multivorans]